MLDDETSKCTTKEKIIGDIEERTKRRVAWKFR
jgi:hypothetical protein